MCETRTRNTTNLFLNMLQVTIVVYKYKLFEEKVFSIHYMSISLC